MRIFPIIPIVLITGLASSWWWYVHRQETGQDSNVINMPGEPSANSVEHTPENNFTPASSRPESQFSTAIQAPESRNLLQEIQNSISQRQYGLAMQQLNTHYSALSSADIETLGLSFLHYLRTDDSLSLDGRYQLQLALAEVFQDERVWQVLANTAVRRKAWHDALEAQIQVTSFQSDPQDIDRSMQALLGFALSWQAELASRNDNYGIVDVFERLHSLYPAFSRFQLELANSQLQVERNSEARRHLQYLSNDTQFGDIAQQTLARLDQNSTLRASSAAIVVPLRPAGTSYLVNTSIDNQTVQLLLDTGASITSLTINKVSDLGLRPLNRQIRLQTANGTVDAQLYIADRLQLGKLVIKNVQIAALPMQPTPDFDGLLGTDVLTAVAKDFSYVIDNQRSSLIFKAR